MLCKRILIKFDSKIMTAILYDNNKVPIKTVHVGADGYTDYTMHPHENKKNIFEVDIEQTRTTMIIQAQEPYLVIHYDKHVYINATNALSYEKVWITTIK